MVRSANDTLPSLELRALYEKRGYSPSQHKVSLLEGVIVEDAALTLQYKKHRGGGGEGGARVKRTTARGRRVKRTTAWRLSAQRMCSSKHSPALIKRDALERALAEVGA